jgi:hypothetical protein
MDLVICGEENNEIQFAEKSHILFNLSFCDFAVSEFAEGALQRKRQELKVNIGKFLPACEAISERDPIKS